MENGDVAQGVKVLPGNALRVRHPVLFTARITAGGWAFVKRHHVRRIGARLQLSQLVGVVGLEAHVVNARGGATGGNGKVDRRVFQHPLGVICFVARWRGSEELVVKADALREVLNMQVNVKAFHESPWVNH